MTWEKLLRLTNVYIDNHRYWNCGLSVLKIERKDWIAAYLESHPSAKARYGGAPSVRFVAQIL